MYKHILVPTDGSALSQRAVRTAGGLASLMGARITALYVIPQFHYSAEGSSAGHGIVEKHYKEIHEQEGKKALAEVEIEATANGVAYDGVLITAEEPWKAIAETARTKECDLIVMSSHGRRGLEGILLGSETSKVLTHSKTPVLVCR